MLHVETEKLSIHVRKKRQDLTFFVGKGRLAAPLLGYSRQRVHTTLSKTKCQEKTVRTRHPYSIKSKNFFSASKNFWLWDFPSQHPYWIFLLFVLFPTPFEGLLSPQHSKHHMLRDISSHIMRKPDIQFDFHWSMQGSEGFHTVVLQRQHLELGPGFEKISFQKPNGISMLEADNTAFFCYILMLLF